MVGAAVVDDELVLAAFTFIHFPPAALHWAAGVFAVPLSAISLLALSTQWRAAFAAKAGLDRSVRPSTTGIKCFTIVMFSFNDHFGASALPLEFARIVAVPVAVMNVDAPSLIPSS